MEAKMKHLQILGLDEDLTKVIRYIVDAWNLVIFCDLTEGELEYMEDKIHDIEFLLSKVQMRRNNPGGWR